MPTFFVQLAFQSVYSKASKKGEARTGVPMVPFLCSSTNLQKPQEKEAEKQIGCLDDHLLLLLRHVVLLQLQTTPKTTNKEEPTPMVQLTGEAKKVRKGIAADANLLCPVGALIGIRLSLKKGKSKDRGANGSVPLVTNQLAKTQK